MQTTHETEAQSTDSLRHNAALIALKLTASYTFDANLWSLDVLSEMQKKEKFSVWWLSQGKSWIIPSFTSEDIIT